MAKQDEKHSLPLAILGSLTLIIVAIIAYKASIKAASVPIEATQTAEASLRRFSSTPTLTPSMNERDLADIFPTYATGRAFEFNFLPAQVKTSFVEDCGHSGRGGLRLEASDVTGEASAGWYVEWYDTALQYLDLTPFNAIYFYVRGFAGSETFEIGLEDDAGNPQRLRSTKWLTVTTDWKYVKVPLADYQQVNPRRIVKISFSFNRDDKMPETLCIDDISFVP